MENELQSRKDKRAAESRRKRGVAPIIAGIAVAALVPIIGSTYAANISLNSGTDIQFAQGSQGTATCDATIDITPASVYSESSGTFLLNTVTLSAIDAACVGESVQLVIKLTGSENDITTTAVTIADNTPGGGADDVVIEVSDTVLASEVAGFALEVR
jgi:hypothetical protein